MTQPTVAAIMLANGRPEMVARAVKSFRAQTYENKFITIWHNDGKQSIGALRNEANAFSVNMDILINWDSDDWSHPNRIAEQVALLQSSGAECVGYNEMLFWADACAVHFVGMTPAGVSCACGNRYPRTYGYCDKCDAAPPDAEAWLYRAAIPAYAIGTSMCYWRETWERHPFPDRSEGCDDLEWFNAGVKIASAPAFVEETPDRIAWQVPRMIASIHGGNTCSKIDAKAREWTRVPHWDSYCRANMSL